MLILHASVLDREFLVWGEKPSEAAPPPSRKRRPSVEDKQPEPLVNDAGRDVLLEALAAANAGISKRDAVILSLVAWLPSAGTIPVASSPIIAEAPPEKTKVSLRPWMVTAIPISAEKLIEFLCACAGKEILAPGVIAGKDLVFWVTAMRFAGALVARQQYLPSLIERDGLYMAQWEPVFVGVETRRFAQLVKAMPASARALSRKPDRPAQRSTPSIISDFLSVIVDQLVRETASPESLQSFQQTPLSVRRKRGPKIARETFESLHDYWLHALLARDPSIDWDSGELITLARQIREWRSPVATTEATPFRLCFRLDEPSMKDENLSVKHQQNDEWAVRYFLQATDDLSLLVPAKNVWKPQSAKSRVLQRKGFNAKACLLSALGQASGLCANIESSLKSPAPEGYQIDAAGAHAFLSEKAWALEQSGFGVLLPAWWTGKGTKLKLAGRAVVKSPKMQGGSGLSLDEIMKFHWEVALGGSALSAEELEALANLKVPLVRMRGQWVSLNAEEIQAALEMWKKKGEATVREVIQMALGAGRVLRGIDFQGVAATGWIAEVLKQLEGKSDFSEEPVSNAFSGTLRPYQVRGYSWLAFLQRWGLGACLADDMGLGKTIQTLALIQRDWASTEEKRPVLLICPTSVTGNWEKEAMRFTPELPVLVHHGTSRQKGSTFKRAAERHALVVSSYALVYRDLEALKQVPWRGVILDEAQNIKNAETKQAKAARALPSGYRIALTGTPVENNVGDLWSIMEFLNPGFLGTQAEFKRSFFIPIQATRDIEAVGRLKRLTGPFILRRLKTDKSIISDLPEKMEMKVFCTLTKEQASLYEAVVKEAAAKLEDAEGIGRKGVVLATLSMLKQVCNHPAQFFGDNSAVEGRSGKLARLTEMIEEIVEVGDRALVFSQFSEMGELIRKHLQETFGRETLFLHGGVPKPHRDRMVERFQQNEGPPVFILSLKAGGTGLNLTQATHVFHFDRWWNPAVENQATDRAFRIGQKRRVQVHKFLCKGTLEEKIDEMIERKREVAEQVVGTSEGWLTELSNSQLKELFALRKDAIGE